MRLTLLALLALPLAAIAADVPEQPADPAAAPAPKLAGKLEEGRYFSATGLFSMPVPELDPETAGLLDTPNIVVFRDRVDTFISIRSFKLTADEKWNLETSNPKDYTVRFFKEFVLPEFKSQFPGSTAESATFLPDLEGGTLFAYLLVPGGSAFEVDALVRAHPDTKVPPAKQLVMLFVHDDQVFLLSSELAERVTELSTYMLTTKDEDRILRERLLRVLNSMTFTKPATAAAPATPTPAAPAAAAASKAAPPAGTPKSTPPAAAARVGK